MAANRYAIATGNYSNPAIWNGGLGVPASDDTVRPNGFTVTIDTNITAALLTNNASSPAVAGGSFQVTSTGTISITANIDGRANGHVLRVLGAGSTVNVVGTLKQLTSLSAAVLTYCISVEVACTFTHTGNATGGLNNVNYGPSTGCIRFATGNSTVSLTGVYTGGSSQALTPNPAVYVESGAPTITLNGSVIGGGTSLNYGILIASTTAYLIVNGVISASVAAPAIHVTSVGSTPMLVSGQINNVNGNNAIFSPTIKLLKDASTIWTYQTNDSLANKLLYTADELTGYPPENKVENGEVFGPANEFEGTLDPVTISAGQIADLANAVGQHLTPQVLATLKI